MIEKPMTPHADAILGSYWEEGLTPGQLSDRSLVLAGLAADMDNTSLDGQVKSQRMLGHGSGNLVTAMSSTWRNYFVRVGDIGSRVGQASGLLAEWAATLNAMLTEMAGVVWAAEAGIQAIEVNELELTASGQDPQAMIRAIVVEAQGQIAAISAAAAAGLAGMPEWAGGQADEGSGRPARDSLIGDSADRNVAIPGGEVPSTQEGPVPVSQRTPLSDTAGGVPATRGSGTGAGTDSGASPPGQSAPTSPDAGTSVDPGAGAPGRAAPTGSDNPASSVSPTAGNRPALETTPTSSATTDVTSAHQPSSSTSMPGRGADGGHTDRAPSSTPSPPSSAGLTRADAIYESGPVGVGLPGLPNTGTPVAAAANALAAAAATTAVAQPVAPSSAAPVAPPVSPVSPVTGSAFAPAPSTVAVPPAAVPVASAAPMVTSMPSAGAAPPAQPQVGAAQIPPGAAPQSQSNNSAATGQASATAPVIPPVPAARVFDDAAGIFIAPFGGRWTGGEVPAPDPDLAALQWVLESAGGGDEDCWAAGMLVTDARRQVVVTTDRGRSWFPRNARLPADVITPWTHPDCARWEGLRDPARVIIEHAAAIPGASLTALVSSAGNIPAVAVEIPFAFVRVSRAVRSQVTTVSRMAFGVRTQHLEAAASLTEPEQQRKQALWLAHDAVHRAGVRGKARTIVDFIAAQPQAIWPHRSAGLSWQQLAEEHDQLRSMERTLRLDVRDIPVGEVDTGGGRCRELLIAAYACEAVVALCEPDARQALEDALYSWSMLMELVAAKGMVTP